MAFFLTDEDEDQKTFKTGESATGGAGATGGGAGGTAAPERSKGTGWTNLQSYLGAGGQEAGERMAGQVTGALTGEMDAEKKRIQEEAAGQISGLKEAFKPQDVSEDYFKSPGKIDKAEFQSLYTQDMPEQRFKEDALAGIADKWQGKEEAAGGFGGRQALAGKYLGGDRADYGRGLQGLDAFLMGRGEPQLEQKIGQMGEDIETYLGEQRGRFETAAQQRGEELGESQERFRDLFEAAKTDAAGGVGRFARVDPTTYQTAESYEQAGQEAAGRLAALQGLIGEDVAPAVDWQAKWEAAQPEPEPIEEEVVPVAPSKPKVDGALPGAARNIMDVFQGRKNIMPDNVNTGTPVLQEAPKAIGAAAQNVGDVFTGKKRITDWGF